MRQSVGLGLAILATQLALAADNVVRKRRIPPAEPVGPMFDPPKETRQMRRHRERQEAKRSRP